jgi:hypothetical protein
VGTAAVQEMHVPKGWIYVSEYCIRRGDYTICKIGGADGWRYELWHLTEQQEVNLPSAEAAIKMFHVKQTS